MSEYTDAERDTIRNAAFGAIALVSKADPGFLASFKETLAGSKALASGSQEVTAILRSGGFPTPPKGDAETQKQTILADLREAMTLLRGKADGADQAFAQAIEQATQAVADASDGVSPQEQAVLDEVRAALA